MLTINFKVCYNKVYSNEGEKKMENKKVMVKMASGKIMEGKILIDRTENTGYCLLINGSVHYNVSEKYIEFI
jgi:hypothetical protein